MDASGREVPRDMSGDDDEVAYDTSRQFPGTVKRVGVRTAVNASLACVQFDEDERMLSAAPAPTVEPAGVAFGGAATRIAATATTPPTRAMPAPTRNALRYP